MKRRLDESPSFASTQPRGSATLSVRYLCLLAIATGFTLGAPAAAAESGERVARVGYVDPHSETTSVPGGLSAFRKRLRELGWMEGRNLVLDTRWADGRIEHLPALMAEVIRQDVDVLVTMGTPAAIAAKKATSTIPIVLAGIGDPVGSGVVQGLARPGGNVTGLSLEITEELSGKYLELLMEVVPGLSTVAAIGNPDNPMVRKTMAHLKSISAGRKLKISLAEVREPSAFDAAFRQARRTAQAAVVLPDPLLVRHRERITGLAAEYRLPAIYTVLEFSEAGGLMAHGVDASVIFRRAAEYVDKILGGTKPADLPIEQPTQFKLVVNLKTAKALRLTIPQSILLQADEVIR